jgi:F0F1-type ATP synthase assembly protein I
MWILLGLIIGFCAGVWSTRERVGKEASQGFLTANDKVYRIMEIEKETK